MLMNAGRLLPVIRLVRTPTEATNATVAMAMNSCRTNTPVQVK